MRVNFSCLTKKLESLSCSCREKGEHNIFDSSEMLSITSTISWHHDTDETASHLQSPPCSLDFKIHCYFSSHMLFRAGKCQGMYNNVQWFTVCRANLCDLPPSFIPGASLLGNISGSIAPGRKNFLLQWGCSLTYPGLCHLSNTTSGIPVFWQLSNCNNWGWMRQSKGWAR